MSLIKTNKKLRIPRKVSINLYLRAKITRFKVLNSLMSVHRIFLISVNFDLRAFQKLIFKILKKETKKCKKIFIG